MSLFITQVWGFRAIPVRDSSIRPLNVGQIHSRFNHYSDFENGCILSSANFHYSDSFLSLRRQKYIFGPSTQIFLGLTQTNKWLLRFTQGNTSRYVYGSRDDFWWSHPKGMQENDFQTHWTFHPRPTQKWLQIDPFSSCKPTPIVQTPKKLNNIFWPKQHKGWGFNVTNSIPI